MMGQMGVSWTCARMKLNVVNYSRTLCMDDYAMYQLNNTPGIDI